ncbi:MAG TPA: acyltransferase [Burkholderiales bacterium]|nr:acyltransferase [Burkholderiales bacterium]
MTRAFSLYLDLLRFAAAMVVFLGHMANRPFTEAPAWGFMSRYPGVAVTLFFVLSGYVISYVSQGRENSWRPYGAARLSRLYSVVAVGLLLTFVLDAAGMRANPEFYGIRNVMWKPPSWDGYAASFFFVNEFQVFGFQGISPGSNGPYWSLSFEATYYALAGLVMFSSPLVWVPAGIVLLGMAGKTITALAPIWLLGFLIQRHQGRLRLGSRMALVLLVGSAAAIIASPSLVPYLPNLNFGMMFPWGRGHPNRWLSSDYFVAVMFAIHLVSARQLCSERLRIDENVSALIRWAGSLTFPLYCFHYPAICFFAAVSVWPKTALSNAAFIATGTLAIVVILTPACERLKDLMRGLLLGSAALSKPSVRPGDREARQLP